MNQTQFEKLKNDASATFPMNDYKKQQTTPVKNEELSSTNTIKSQRNTLTAPAIILASGLIIAAFLYAYAHRYNINGNYIEDKWTGTYKELVEKK